ncbi:MAG: metallophosphoesterase [Deltaproteobacteria bacterium]|nr:metallophosphoesterase [Deltaproteobacteria bacterium]
MPRLLAISDLHVRHKANRAAVESTSDHPDDWLIIAGDVCEKAEDLAWVLDTLGPRFAQLLWVPGNHELWSHKGSEHRGEDKYLDLVRVCRERGVLTPEDPWAVLTIDGREYLIALLFLLFDYSFAPPGMDPEQAIAWAREAGIMCIDELRLHSTPYPTRQDWCAARVAASAERLAKEHPELPRVLVNHWPLRRDVVRIPRVPRFLPWCGTALTEDWHTRFGAEVVVSGHLHVRATDYRDGVRFEEVSLGYPRNWRPEMPFDSLLREVLPGPAARDEVEPDPRWHALGGPRRRNR